MVSLNAYSFSKYLYYGYSSFNVQYLVYVRIEDFSCKYIISNSGLECIYFMDAQSYEASHFKEYHWLKYSNAFEINQLLFFLLNVIILIVFILEPDLLLNFSECLIYLVNQVPLFHPLHPN